MFRTSRPTLFKCLDRGLRLTVAVLFIAGPLALVAQQTLKVDVNLVSVFVTVQDQRGEFVTDLSRADFAVHEDDKPQELSVFEKESAVRSAIGILMDVSGSMVDILPHMNRGVREFSRTISFPDEYSIIAFGTTVRLIHRSPQTAQHLDQALQGLKPWGTSVFFDAISYGMERVRSSVNERKALLAFSDGNDNGSSIEFNRVVRDAQLSGVVLYFVAIGPQVLVDRNTLESLSKTTGGRVFYVAKGEAVSPHLERIRGELSRQYFLGYYVQRSPGFHRIRVEIPGRPGLTIHTRSGYLGG